MGYFCIHSFIHYGDLYSAPSRLLLRSAPDPCTAKKKSFETRVECVRSHAQSLYPSSSVHEISYVLLNFLIRTVSVGLTITEILLPLTVL